MTDQTDTGSHGWRTDQGVDVTTTSTATPLAVDDFTGLRRELEIGIQVAPTRATAPAAAKALAAFLDAEPNVPVRLAGLAATDSRVVLTLGLTMGTVDDIKAAGATSRAAVLLVQRIVDALAAYDPAFATLPEPSSAEARLATHVTAHAGDGRHSLAVVVRALASVS